MYERERAQIYSKSRKLQAVHWEKMDNKQQHISHGILLAIKSRLKNCQVKIFMKRNIAYNST